MLGFVPINVVGYTLTGLGGLIGMLLFEKYFPFYKFLKISKWEIHLNPKDNSYVQKQPYTNKDTYLYTLRIGVKSKNEADTIKKVEVKLKEISPSIKGLYGLPLPLHFMHNNTPPMIEQKDIQPLDEIFIDVLNYFVLPEKQQQNFLRITHIVDGISGDIPINKYKLKINVTSENSGTLIKYITFDPEKDDENMWVMLDGKEKTNT